ncbi:FHA domain-containing protein [Dictyobacter kobayashii]|uniref:FHA domain-containing protein n=1 Tax=Dictyobacter kobayashii TaxID=2014872 RepID=A0A402AJT9_9CHLR|nr:FHA domain-containing protein [Dictyobacter kobayashii]GCE19329.1 hypothetical protein KDK_31290 [Dictyobacter kobayashii]
MCSALLLVPVFIWYHFRLSGPHTLLTVMERWGVIAYSLICGWINPILSVILFWLFGRAQAQVIATHSQSSELAPTSAPSTSQPPRYQAGKEAPYVFREDIPWGWLEYKNGNFQGQRLALKRVVATLGREEDCDIWLDDEMASRHHAELAWHEGQVYLTDCGSLNGILLNGQRVQGSVLVSSLDLMEIGKQQFGFILAEQKELLADQYDPLINHTWRSTFDLQAEGDTSSPLPAAIIASQQALLQPPDEASFTSNPVSESGYFLVRDGERMGQRLSLDGAIITIGRGLECTIMLNDVSVAQVHAQISNQAGELYLQDLTNCDSTFLNDLPVRVPCKLKAGDIVRIGIIRLEYGRAAQLRNTTMPPIPVARSANGPLPLRLPSRMKPQ